jgi:hypothetical protein
LFIWNQTSFYDLYYTTQGSRSKSTAAESHKSTVEEEEKKRKSLKQITSHAVRKATKHLLGVGGSESAGEAALAEVVLNGALLGTSALGECNGSTEWSGESSVLELGNADVAGTADGTGAGHASWHLDLDWEIHDGGSGETANADTWNVGGDLCGFEGSDVSSTGGTVDHGGEGSSTVLVDLVEGHLYDTGVTACWHAVGDTSSRSSLDTSLDSALGGLGSLTGKETTLGHVVQVDLTGSLGSGGVACSAIHEDSDHL